MDYINNRRSIRKYTNRPVDKDDIEQIIKAGSMAPSAKNRQPWKYIVYVSDERVTEICDTLSIGASVENILLKATELGLGTLWIANTCFAYNELIEWIGSEGQLVGAIALGYADEHPPARPRKQIKDILEYR